jgi:uncharacterized membrane protein YraQ (UPF0718 family)
MNLHLFIETFVHYLHDLWFSLLLGFLLSGIFYEFVPSNLVEKHLGNRNLSAILWSSLAGTLLPLCCFGSLPVAMSMRRKGAQLGPVLAFLVTAPATSVSALAVTARLLGISFAVYIFFAVILMGLIVGIVGNYLKVPAKAHSEHQPEKTNSCCGGSSCGLSGSDDHPHAETFNAKMVSALRYAFITLPKEIGVDMILGIALASFIVIFDPIQVFIRKYLLGMAGYIAIIISGLATYVCCTASVPLADALLKSGMTPGHAMTFLLVGPITSYGTIFVMWKEFGGKVLTVYLLLISFLSFLLGIVYNRLLA